MVRQHGCQFAAFGAFAACKETVQVDDLAPLLVTVTFRLQSEFLFVRAAPLSSATTALKKAVTGISFQCCTKHGSLVEVGSPPVRLGTDIPPPHSVPPCPHPCTPPHHQQLPRLRRDPELCSREYGSGRGHLACRPRRRELQLATQGSPTHHACRPRSGTKRYCADIRLHQAPNHASARHHWNHTPQGRRTLAFQQGNAGQPSSKSGHVRN